MVTITEQRQSSSDKLTENIHMGIISIGDASDQISLRVTNTGGDSYTNVGIYFKSVTGDGMEDAIRLFDNAVYTWPQLPVLGLNNIGGIWVVCNEVATQVRRGVGVYGSPIIIGSLGSEAYIDFDLYLGVPESQDAVGTLKFVMAIEYESVV